MLLAAGQAVFPHSVGLQFGLCSGTVEVVIADAGRQSPDTGGVSVESDCRSHCDRADDAILHRRIATLMTTKSRNKPAGKPASSGAQQPAKDKKQPFVSRYIGIDTHLATRGGSADLVDGIATERPAGRKLADDINRQCIQLNAEGYDVVSVFPITSGRIAESFVKNPQNVYGWTYSRQKEVHEDTWLGPRTRTDNQYYHNVGVGYSVTDGVVIIARLRQ